MKFLAEAIKPQDIRTEILVLCVPQLKTANERHLKVLDTATGGALSSLISSEEFTGKEGEVVTFYRPAGYKAAKLILLGLGETAKIKPDTFRRTTGILSRHKSLQSCKQVTFSLGDHLSSANAQAIAEGYLLGSYTMNDYRTDGAAKTKPLLKELSFIADKQTSLRGIVDGAEKGQVIAEGQNLVRKLGFMPSNELTPRMYVQRIQTLAKPHKVQVEVLDEKAIAKEKMGLLLGVAKGSVEPPRFVILRYNGRAASHKPVVLVGKGVTFDSGGISIKPGQDMHEMKGDMTGSAVVLAAIISAARLRLPINVVGLLPLTENMPSGHALKPGDVITSRLGKTVEIINTDAEGRLILADALDYANKFKPQAVIDIATLTGAALFVLGYAGAPFVSTNDKLADRIRSASKATAEQVWQMPLWEEYYDYMKSSIADLVNSGGRPAGTLSASAFLDSFTGDYPWAHIDIAYMDMEHKGRAYIPKGNTGWGCRLLVNMLENWKAL